MSSRANLRAKVTSRLKASVRTRVIEKLRSAREMDPRQAFTLAQQYVDTLRFEELRDLHANGINLRKVHSKLTKMNSKRQAKIDELSNGRHRKQKKEQKLPEMKPPTRDLELDVKRAASRSAARRKQKKMDVWASMMAYDVEQKKKEDKEKARLKQAELATYRQNLAAQSLEKKKQRERERREEEAEKRRVNDDVRKYAKEQAKKQKEALKRANLLKQEAFEMEQARQQRLAAAAEEAKRETERLNQKMADDVRKMREEQQLALERKKDAELKLKLSIDEHNEHLRKMRLEEIEYFNSIQRESDRRFKVETRKRAEKKAARDAAIAAKVKRMNLIHKAHTQLMSKQNKQEELGRELTQARREAEQRAKVERRQAQEKEMFESISQMRINHMMRRKQEEEEEERFAAIIAKDTQKYQEELEAEKQRKKAQIVARKKELDSLFERDRAIKTDKEVQLAVLAINKPLLAKVQQANVGDVSNYLKKVENTSRGKRRRRRRRDP